MVKASASFNPVACELAQAPICAGPRAGVTTGLSLSLPSSPQRTVLLLYQFSQAQGHSSRSQQSTRRPQTTPARAGPRPRRHPERALTDHNPLALRSCLKRPAVPARPARADRLPARSLTQHTPVAVTLLAGLDAKSFEGSAAEDYVKGQLIPGVAVPIALLGIVLLYFLLFATWRLFKCCRCCKRTEPHGVASKRLRDPWLCAQQVKAPRSGRPALDPARKDEDHIACPQPTL